MRTIKLRAWSKLDNPKLKFVLKEIDYELWFVMENDEQIKYTFSAVYLDDDWIKEEYTGLFDKNGVEIYEGDKCKILDDIGVVTYIDSFYSIIGKNSQQSFGYELWENIDFIEVIGNIHESDKT
jgi:uncharacterized phage protein (TIGR01671 family)